MIKNTAALTAAVIFMTLSIESLAQSYYTQTGTDRTWEQILKDKAIPIGRNSTAGITGSKINVNRALVEIGPYKNQPIPNQIALHSVGHSVINRNDFSKWSRWYQEDGNTQIYRLFKGEENVRNSRPEPAARAETFLNKFRFSPGKTWHEFHARYTLVDVRGCVGPHYCGVFQNKATKEAWGVMMKIKDNGDVLIDSRKGNDKVVLQNMNGKSFDFRCRDNGDDWEVYIDNKLVHKGSYLRNQSDTTFRWGVYMGKSVPSRDLMIFITGASLNPKGLDLTPVDPSDPIDPVEPVARAPFNGSPANIPGIIQAEEFDLGGEGKSYSDTTPENQGDNVAREDEAVDIDLGPDGGTVVGWTDDGEWLEYTVNVTKPGQYDVDFWVSSMSGGSIGVAVDGKSLAPTVSIPATGGWDSYQFVSVKGLPLKAGKQIMRISIPKGGMNIDYLDIRESIDSNNSSSSSSSSSSSASSSASNSTSNSSSNSSSSSGGSEETAGALSSLFVLMFALWAFLLMFREGRFAESSPPPIDVWHT